MAESRKAPRLLALAGATVALLCVALATNTRQWLGFPDGHLTEREAALRPLLGLYIGAGGAFALMFLALAALGGRVHARWLVAAGLGFVLLTGAAMAWSRWGLAGLEHGQGG